MVKSIYEQYFCLKDFEPQIGDLIMHIDQNPLGGNPVHYICKITWMSESKDLFGVIIIESLDYRWCVNEPANLHRKSIKKDFYKLIHFNYNKVWWDINE